MRLFRTHPSDTSGQLCQRLEQARQANLGLTCQAHSWPHELASLASWPGVVEPQVCGLAAPQTAAAAPEAHVDP